MELIALSGFDGTLTGYERDRYLDAKRDVEAGGERHYVSIQHWWWKALDSERRKGKTWPPGTWE